ncbi:MAG: class I SAM-dependent rRNA methyltransferase [Planctomycetales bacterium]|nr:class I SAM-dependent rRNA methyltransferase [Planctomycetales bacterium]
MHMVRAGKQLPVRLRKDLTRSIKRGHAWLFSDAIELVIAPAGSVALLSDRQGDKQLASGIYAPEHAIPLRVCRTQPPFALDDAWLQQQLEIAAELRARVFDAQTTGYRMVAGEGDGLPGLIIDIYDRTAVIKLDGGGPEAFYQPRGIARWLQTQCGMQCVVLRSRERGQDGETLLGETPTAAIPFLENGLRFSADVLRGQKTGFFLDQRDNRALVGRLSRGCRVLNLYSYNGGFSVAAGQGGAQHVTSVDIARPAIEAAERHWLDNGLPPQSHRGQAADCFGFLQAAVEARESWELVICDPPSFAPSEKVRPRALAAYGRLAQWASRVTSRGGLLALASCSSHVDRAAFTAVNVEALGRARRKASLLADCGLPLDHPTPLAMPELRYLKFQLFRLD